MSMNPDLAGVHDVRTLNGIMICARCYWRAGLERLPHRFPERCEPDVTVHFSDWRDGSQVPLCGAPQEEGIQFEDDRTPVTCPDCRAAIEAQPRLGPHDLRKWGLGALCARCGERGGDPDTLGPCVPLRPPSSRSFRLHAACDPLDREGPVLCGAAAANRHATVTLLRIDTYATEVRCPDCLEVAGRQLPAYASGPHDLRLGGDGVICPVCGIAAATPEDAGGCPGDAPVEMLHRRKSGGGRLAGTLSGIRHAPGGGCRHAPPADIGWGDAADGSRRFRVTCLNCLRFARGLPRAVSISAQP